jgi:hypothetical protein
VNITDDLFKKTLAERDSYKDLAERAIVAMAMLQYGPLCSGKVVAISGYYWRISQTDGKFSAELIEVK